MLIENQTETLLQPRSRKAEGPNWESDETRSHAFHDAAQALICFLLYGEEVVREVVVRGRGAEAGGVSTFSKLPIPMVCRPSGGEPRRGNPAPVSSDAIVDAHGILSYAGAVAESLLVSWEARAENLQSPATLERMKADRAALAAMCALVGSDRAPETFFSEYWEEAARLLRSNWPAVGALAEVLESQGRLNGARVDDLLRSFENL